MSDHILCTRCLHANPQENHFCDSCGASLEASRDLVVPEENGLTVMGHTVPLRLGPVGKALAAGLVTLTAEVGLYWLRHRTRAAVRPPTLTIREPGTTVFERLSVQSLEEIFIQNSEGYYRGQILGWRAIRSIAIKAPTDRRS